MLTKNILEFKLQSAEALGWLYDFCREGNKSHLKTAEIRQDIIKFCKMLDFVQNGRNSKNQETELVEFIRRTRGIKPADNKLLSINSIFPHKVEKSVSLLEKISNFLNIDLGDIEEIFEKLINSIAAIKEYLLKYYRDVLRNGSGILEKIDMITESLKRMKADKHLLIHIQTRLEMNQIAVRAA